MTDKVRKIDEEWRRELDPERYAVLRCAATERRGAAISSRRTATACTAVGRAEPSLFSSETKFESGSGWPSFFAPVSDDAIEEEVDTSHGMRRIEARYAVCDLHLGHIFPDGPHPTGLRYCMNSLALEFEPAEDD